MESVAIIKVAIGVRRTELMGLCQDYCKPFRTFSPRVCSKVELCSFTTVSEYECGKQNVTSHEEEAIKNVIVLVKEKMTSGEKTLVRRISCPGHLMK